VEKMGKDVRLTDEELVEMTVCLRYMGMTMMDVRDGDVDL
jgi:hypothetical protein